MYTMAELLHLKKERRVFMKFNKILCGMLVATLAVGPVEGSIVVSAAGNEYTTLVRKWKAL